MVELVRASLVLKREIEIMLRKLKCSSLLLVFSFSFLALTIGYISSFALDIIELPPPDIIVEDPIINDKSKADFCIFLDNYPYELCEFTMDLRFNPYVLEYSAFPRGDLTRRPGFNSLNINPDVH